MKVEIWADVVCPWCRIGQERLEKAIESVDAEGDIEVSHRSFQLDPRAPQKPQPVRELLAEKYGMGDGRLEKYFDRIESLAADEGISPYRVRDNAAANTEKTHELLAMASEKGLEDKAWRRLYDAYFGEQRPIFDIDSLVELGEEIGLDPEEVRRALSEDRFADRVKHDVEEARKHGASGVPFVLIDGKYPVTGAQPTETFQKVLQRVISDT